MLKPFNMKKIIIAVTGGIAAYKATDIISALINKGHEVKVITTDSALNFVTSHVLNVISRGNLVTENPGETKHIEMAKWADAFVLVPATANTIAKISNGIADNLVTTTFLALHDETYKFICPAMNTYMWDNRITQENLARLGYNFPFGPLRNVKIINPVEGLLACGDIGMGKLAPTKVIVDEILNILEDIPIWKTPIPLKYKGETNDSYSFLDLDLNTEFEIPIYPHVGSFGIRRRHDVHNGVDLYAPVNTQVFAVEPGKIVEICHFTGPEAGCEWWLPTKAVYVEGDSGIVVYGEIYPNEELKIGDTIGRGSLIGTVQRVIVKDKGRPMSMLHLELHTKDTIHAISWITGEKAPHGVLDPTKYLVKSK